MLKQMREKTKTILWIVVVAFVVSIFAVWGMNLRAPTRETEDRDVVGAVDGEFVSRQAYVNMHNELYNQLMMQKGENYVPNETERQMLDTQAWEMTVQKMLVAKEIEKHGIIVTDDELVAFLRRNPHPALRQHFVNDEGEFDYQEYLRALANPEGDWTQLEMWGRSIIPEMKLEALLSSQIHVSDREVLERFEKENAEVRAVYVEIPFVESEEPYEPTDEEIAIYYAESKDDFLTPERRAVKLITIETVPTELDEQEVRDQLLEIREEIRGGKDFSEAAEDYSDDPATAENGGDLGFFKKEDMAAEFSETAFALEIGELSEPVRTQFGYHLILVEEKKTEDDIEKVRARHILMKVDLGHETLDSLGTLVRGLRDAIKEHGFEKAAEGYGLEIIEPEPFTDGYFIRDIGYVPRIINFAFNHRSGTISGPIGTETTIYYVKITREIPESVKPLNDVRSIIVSRIRNKRMQEAAKAVAETVRQEALTSGDLAAAALARELKLKETPLFKEADPVPGIGANTAFTSACHELPEGKLSPPIRGSNAYYLIKAVERIAPDMNEFEEKRTEIMNLVRSDKATRFMANWYDVLRKNANVEDLRENTIN